MTGEKPGSFRWFLVFWLFILSAVAFLDRVNISVQGASIAASYQLLAPWVPSQVRRIANGWTFAGVGAGAGLSPPLITFLMLHYGWRASFCVCAGLGLIVGAVWFLTARDSPAEHPSVSSEE